VTITLHDEAPTLDEARVVYDANGWSTYTSDPEVLRGALFGASYVCAAREDGALVGLIRVVSDGAMICYIQDILVHPDHHRRGIGRMLVERALERYRHVRQKVLLTDDRPEQKAFYEALGFHDTRDLERTVLRAFVRIEGAQLS